MKIEVNNVYQKKTISKVKIGIIIFIFVILLGIIVWRLYYERMQTTGVSSFAEFIGLSSIMKHENLNNNVLNNEIIQPDISKEANKYIPNFTEQGMININSIYNLREDGQKVAYLTFDDGPSLDVTTRILDTLKSEGIYGSFFVVGYKVEQNPDVLKRIYNEGHYIANHGYSHKYSQVYKSCESVLEEYQKCEETIRNVLQIPEYETHLFRFPGGSAGGPYNSIKKSAISLLKEKNIGIIDWNALTKDSEGNHPREKLFEYFKQTSTRQKQPSYFNA